MQKYFIVLMLLISSICAFGQTKGLVYKPASSAAGKLVLDPNGDGYTSQTTEGFISNDWGWGESEVKYQRIPILENEPISDPLRGPGCGFTDMVDSGEGDPVGFFFDGTNFLVRFRLNKTSPNSKGYSVLIDTDQKFGFTGANADPNAVSGNPGFELEMVLMTNHSVSLYNVDGTSTPVLIASRDYDSHTQKSIAYTQECGDPDYFYDFYLPWSVFGIPSTTPLRMTALTVMNPQPAIGNNAKSDVGGVDDRNYSGNYDQLFQDFLDNFNPTAPTDFDGGIKALSKCPTINSVLVSATSITGTSTEASGTIITVYKNNVALPGTASVTGAGTWTFPVSGLAEGDIITASAKAFDKEESLTNCSPMLVGQSCTRPNAPTLGTSSGNSNKYVSVLATTTGLINLYAGETQLVTNFNATGGTTYYYCAGTSTLSTNSSCGGGNNLPAGVYRATLTVSGCTSNSSFQCVNTSTASSPPVINQPISTVSKTISGTAPVGADLILKINNVEVIKINSTDGTWAIPATSFGLTSTDKISAYSVETGKCQSPETAQISVQQPVSIAPVIFGTYCGTTSNVYGSSAEAEGTTIKLFIGSSTIAAGTTTTNQNGTWQISGLSISPGSQITTKATATGKSESAASATVTIRAITTNAGLIFTDYTLSEGILTPIPTDTETGRKYIGEDAVSISGDGPSGTGTIKLYSDEIFIGSATISSGKWTVTKAANLNNFFLFAGSELTATFTATGACESDPITPPIDVRCAPPINKSISPTNRVLCSGTNPEVTVLESEPYIIYQLYNGSSAVGPSILGTGSNITLNSSIPLTTSTPGTVVNLSVKASKIVFVQGVTCESYLTQQHSITLNPVITDNTIQAPDAGTTYCGPTNIGTITGSDPAGGNGATYTYQWQSSPDNTIWSNISGASSKNLSTGVVAATTHFRRQVFSGSCSDVNASAFITITIEANSLTNTLSYSGATKSCISIDPGLISGTTNTTNFQWQMSTDGLNFTDIPGAEAKAQNYDPSEITQSTYFRRVVSGISCKFVSDPIFFEITPEITNNTLTAPAETVFCGSGSVGEITGNVPSGGSGSISYKWQKSIDNGISYQDISPAVTTQSYIPGSVSATTYFRRIAESNLCTSSISNNIKIAVATTSNTIIEAEDNSIYANETSTTNIIVQLKDGFDENVTAEVCALGLTASNGGAISNITYVNNGTYTATLTSSNTSGTSTISGTLNGTAITDKADVDFVAEPTTGPSMSLSIITAAKLEVKADGVETAEVTIQFKDSDGIDIEVDPGEIAILIDGLAVASNLISNPGDGTFKITLPARIISGSDKVTAKYLGNNLSDSETVNFVPVLNLAKSTITADQTEVIADGSSTATVTVQFKDYDEKNIEVDPIKVSILVDDEVVAAASITDNGGGSFSIILSGRITAESDVITAKFDGSNLTDIETVTFVPVLSLSKSTISADKTAVNADGISSAVVTVQFKDYDEKNIVVDPSMVSILVDDNVVDGTSITNNGGGSFSITLAGRIIAGSDVVTAKYDNTSLSDNETVTFIPALSLTKSTISANKTIVNADSVDFSVVTVQFKDYDDQNIVVDPTKVSIIVDGTAVPADSIINNGGGSYSITLHPRIEAGTDVITAKYSNISIEASETVTFIPVLNLNNSIITANKIEVNADGTNTAIVTIQFKDHDEKNIVVDATKVSILIGGSEVAEASITNNGGGSFSITLAARTVSGPVEITAKYDGNDLDVAETVTFIPVLNLVKSTISADKKEVNADNIDTSVVTVQFKDYDDQNIEVDPTKVAILVDDTAVITASITNNGSGSFSITLPARIIKDTVVVAAKYDNNILADKDTVYFVPALSLVKSTITANKTAVNADNIDTAVVTVQFKDYDSQNIGADPTKIAILLDDIAVVPASITSNGGGSFSITLPARVVKDTVVVTAKYDNNILSDKDTVYFVPVLSLLKSAIIAEKTLVNADNNDTSVVTVQFKDYDDKNIVVDPTKVSILVDDIAVVTASISNNGDGGFSITLPARIFKDTVVVTAKFDTDILSEKDTVYFVPVLSLEKSTIIANKTNVDADGSTTSAVTVRFKDFDDKDFEVDPAKVTILVDGEIVEVDEITNNEDGSYSITVPARIIAETVIVTAKYDGNDLVSSATIIFSKDVSLSKSTISASKNPVDADGISTSVITLQFKDYTDANFLVDANKVSILVDGSAVAASSITNNGEGNYSIILSGRVTPGTVSVTVEYDNKNLDSTLDVQFIPVPSLSNSTVTANNTLVNADGSSTSKVTIQFKDHENSSILVAKENLKIFIDGIPVDSENITSNEDGTFEITLEGRNTAGSVVTTASYKGLPLVNTQTVQFIEFSYGNTSLITASKTEIIADGISTSIITVTINDAQGNRVSTGGDIVTLFTTLGTLGSITDHLDGTYSATLTSSTAIGTANISGKVNDMDIINTANVNFTVSEPSNLAPIAIDDYFTSEMNQKLQGNILSNDEDPDQDNLVVNTLPIEAPIMGMVVLSQNGNFQYTPARGYIGEDTFKYRVCDDGNPSLCTEATVFITIVQPALFIPKGFSPDGDGENDEFIIYGAENHKVSLTIFNRWGNIVYENKEYKNDWIGIANQGLVLGDKLPDGTYFYMVDFNNGEKPQTNYLIIKRKK